MSWVSVAIGVGSAAAGIIGGNKAADAAQAGADAASATQLQMFNQSRQDQAPYRYVGNQALNALATLYGFDPYTQQQPQTASVLGNSSIDSLGFSEKGPANQDDITRLFQVYLGREPEPAALQFYLNSGKTPGEIAAAIQGSTEYRQRGAEGTLPNTAFSANGETAIPQQGTPDMSGFFASPDYMFRLDESIKALDRSAAARGMVNSGAQQKAITNFAGNLASGEFNNYVNRLSALAGVGQSAANQNQAAALATGQGIAQQQNFAGQARASGYLAQGNAIQGGLNALAYGYGNNWGRPSRGGYGSTPGFQSSYDALEGYNPFGGP